MGNSSGRAFIMKKGGAAIASALVNALNWTGDPVDVTNKDSAGVVEFLSGVFATQSLELTIEGYTDDDVLAALALSTTDADKFMTDITLERPNELGSTDTIAGTFVMVAYSETAPDGEGVKFNATLQRSGAHIYTPGV